MKKPVKKSPPKTTDKPAAKLNGSHKLNGKAPKDAKPHHEKTLEERYLSHAELTLRKHGRASTKRELRQLNSDTRADNGLPVWTDDEHENAWIALRNHDQSEELTYVGEGAEDLNRELEAQGRLVPEGEQANTDDVESTEESDEAQTDTAPAPPRVEYRPTRYLECKLTKDQIDEIREARETEDAEIGKLQAELYSVNERVKSLKKRIDTIIEDGLEASAKVRSGVEMRSVECEDRREYDAREGSLTKGELVMVTYRLDTNEAIEWRSLTVHERQGKLWDEAPAKTPGVGNEIRESAP